MMKRYLIGCLCLLSISLAAQAASERAATEQVSAQMVASVSAVHAGEKIWLGVQQKIIPHWHTYWINPGDSGIATRIDWRLPAGASAGEIQWPIPSRFNLGPISNYGYADEVTLLSQIDVPAEVKVGDKFPIDASVTWLVCEEVCIPQTVELHLTLPVVAPTQTNGPGSPLIDQMGVIDQTGVIEKARARLPQPSIWPLQVEAHEHKLLLRAIGAAQHLQRAIRIEFFADQWGRVEHNAAQPHRVDGDDLLIELTAGEKQLTKDEVLTGVLVVTENAGTGPTTIGFNVSPAVLGAASPASDLTTASTTSAASTTAKALPAPVDGSAKLELFSAVLLALLGGVILNLMPCVFPVLSIKALSLLKHADHSPAQTRRQGLAYTGGVLASFALLAALLILLKAGGTQIGWGFQYQSPVFVLIVAYLMFAVGLSLSGVFTFGTSITGVGSNLAARSGYAGSFFTGVLAAIVATPCTAPFMGAAIGFALSKPPLQLLAVFLSLGLGLALPYLLLTWWPPLQRRLPRPGVWMEWLKQGLAFPMYAAAVWLVWVLAQQAGPNAIVFALGGMVVIAFAAWVYQNTRAAKTAWQYAGSGMAIAALLLAIVGGYRGVANSGVANNTAPGVAADARNSDASNTHATNATAKRWEIYSAQRLQSLRAQGKPVFVNFTAAWCISCLVNERVALSQDAVISAFERQGITYLKGDWTNQDREISAKLAEFGRSGVPLYLFFPQGIAAEPVVLPQLLTTDIVLSAIAATPVASALQ